MLPDAHTDFILAVAAEEMGILFAPGILILYGIIGLRMLHAAFLTNIVFMLSIVGLVTNFFFQIVTISHLFLLLFPQKVTAAFFKLWGSPC